MDLELRIKEAIQAEAKKLIDRYQQYHNTLHLEHSRKKSRLKDTPPKLVKTPESWAQGNLHNPFYVHRKASSIAKSIAKKIRENTYFPNPPFIQKIDKTGGGQRNISVYQVPDAAISRLFYSGLLQKNKHRFSSYSYAYRDDRNVHFAIQDIAVDLDSLSRVFVAEFDFSDFFGSISHSYLLEQLKCNGFMVSGDDFQVISAFLKSHGSVGIPQGTSISLFLANLVCWALDKKLERCGVKFARYADDTIVWSQDYAKICEAFECFDEFSRVADIKINTAKSAGINLLKRKGLPAEMSSKDKIDFLGYSLSLGGVSIKDSAVAKLKAQIAYILAKHLLQPLKTRPLRALIIPANNRDKALLSAMAEIRRYLYGGLTSEQILNYLNGRTRRIYFKGLMSYYPLVSDVEQLKMLDGWLVSAVHRAVRARSKLLFGHGHDRRHSFPFNVSRRNVLLRYRSERVSGRATYDVPSLSLLHRALTQAMRETGIEKVMNIKSLSYMY
ncbi:reverse transcriptase domain-containing protein [Pseudomonas farris]